MDKKASKTAAAKAVSPAPAAMDPMTDEDLVTRGLELARAFYKSFGYDAPEGFKFYASKHPQERGMWNLAVIAFEELTATPLNDALDNIGESRSGDEE